MHSGGWWFFGMHAFWWLFWALLLIGLFTLLTPVRRGRERSRSAPLEILQRRYAAGEISTEEYEQRKALLERDASPMDRSS